MEILKVPVYKSWRNNWSVVIKTMIKLITYLDCVTNHRCLGLYFSYWEMIKEENTYTYIQIAIFGVEFIYTP